MRCSAKRVSRPGRSRLKMALRMPDPLYAALAIVMLALVIATAGASFSNPLRRRLRDAEVRVRIRMWWHIVSGFVIALTVGRMVAIVALALVSFVAFKEF